jgi:nucleoside-diphosphate-sugar epimerase
VKVLIIGGNGIISAPLSQLAVQRGYAVTLLNRGRSNDRPPITGSRSLIGDARNPESIRLAVGAERFDVVISFQVFSAEDARAMVEVFENRTGQFIFVSSAAVYKKPILSLPITEVMAVGNPFWPYANRKILAEIAFMDAYHRRTFPITIVRPSHTYDSSVVPLLGGWTTIDRMSRGKPVLVHGDGTTFWTLTRSEDVAVGIAGLFSHRSAIGESFHITSDESHSWDHIFDAFAEATGATARIVHLESESIARAIPEWGQQLLGDLRYNAIFDNSKIVNLVPEFVAPVPLREGARRVVAWHNEHRGRRKIDPRIDATLDAMLSEGASAL